MEELSMRIFGTPDYQSVLEILPPYDGMVKQFLKECEQLQSEQPIQDNLDIC